MIDSPTRELPGDDHLMFSIAASYAGEQNIAINSDNHLLSANYLVAVRGHGSEIATVLPATMTSGDVGYPAYVSITPALSKPPAFEQRSTELSA